MELAVFVRLIRGEAQEDSRPNKALEIPSHLSSWSSYQYRNSWEEIVRHSVQSGLERSIS